MTEALKCYLWEGLNLERYDVMQIIPVNERNAVIIMRCKTPDPVPFCVEYGGGGKYFATPEELIKYVRKRFHRHVTANLKTA